MQPRNYHTHTGAAAAAPPPPPPQPRPQPMINYGPTPLQPSHSSYPSHPPRQMAHSGHHRGYSGQHIPRRMMYGDHHNRTPVPIPARAGIGRGEVAEAQHNLAQLGFYPGPIDGLYGPQTRRAVVAFTTHQGMPTDGQVTHSLLSYLRNDLNERIRPPSVNQQHGPYSR